MPGVMPSTTFARAYAQIRDKSFEYKIVDVQEAADYRIDLNVPEGPEKLDKIIKAYDPEVILCMETLEHINYHFEVMNLLAAAVGRNHARIYITLPHNGNWITTLSDWHVDHCVGFFKGIAERFVTRSDLGRYQVCMFPCSGKYVWYWWIVWILSFFQPVSWGFVISPGSESLEMH